jgi:hypothetical protein
MNALEAGDLLALLAMTDNRNVDEHMADAWAWALADVPAPRAVLAAQQLIRAGEPWVDVKSIRRQLAAMQPAFERDVRSAKARGLIDPTWSPRTPLPVDVEQQLRTQQSTEWAGHNDRPDQITAGPATTAVARAIA